MKKFLLIAGAGYYPGRATDDWIGCFKTYEEAEAQVKIEEVHDYYLKGPRMGEIKETHKRCIVNGLEHDWYDIIDLEEWMNK